MGKKRASIITYVTPSDGNVFEDIGIDFTAAVNLKLRSDLMIVLARWIRTKKYKQAAAADILGVGRPEISDLQRGKVQKFSIDKLVTMLQRAGKNVTVNVADGTRP